MDGSIYSDLGLWVIVGVVFVVTAVIEKIRGKQKAVESDDLD